MLRAAVLGATGIVGQHIVKILSKHPWFQISAVAASERSHNMRYREAGKWRIPGSIPEEAADLILVSPEPASVGDVDIVFSALPADVALGVEQNFARAGHTVVSNASSHRMDPAVPLLNPEVNASHVELIDVQRKEKKWDGAIVTNPNCTTAVLTLSLKPIHDYAGARTVVMSSMQAASGAGYPGVPSLDLIDNVIPYIKNEEEKVEEETKKILGLGSKPAEMRITASCHRVPTIDGHMEAIFVETKKPASPQELAEAMRRFRGDPQELKLPSAPEHPVVVRDEEDRPQTRLDRMEGNGMSVVVGRIRKDSVLGVKYVALGHNLMRGAAGCTVLNGELLKARGFL